MARVKAPKNYVTFVAGKVSDANPLNPVPNSARILMNVDLEANGKISRRLGLDTEVDFVLDNGPFTLSELQTISVDTFEWFNVANSDNATFFVLRIGNTLNFYDEGAIPFSSGKIDEIEIGAFADDSAKAAQEPMQGVSGKGALFMTGARYDPFYVEYDAITQTFTATEILLEKRDFDGVEDGLEIDSRPSSLSANHQYNLLNQGWTQAHIDSFKSKQGVYPSNADIESLGFRTNDDGDRIWDSDEVIEQSLGNTLSAQGHFVLGVFTENRILESGVFGLPAGGTIFRPEAVAFFGGRIWYASLSGEIYFSQLVTDLKKVGKCYQAQDPSSEEFNELLDTDGGVIRILEAGTVKRMIPMADGLAVFATNGIWLISGGDAGFTANNTFIRNISKVGIINPTAIVEAEGLVFFWSEEGIYALIADKISGNLAAQSITDNRIQADYNEIPAAAKVLAHGAYDRVSKRIYWSFHDGQESGTTSLDPKYNSALVYDVTLSAFWDYKIADIPATFTAPFMAGLVKRSALNEGSATTTIVVNGEPVITEAGAFFIQATLDFVSASDTPIKALMFIPDPGGLYQTTFGEFCSRSFHDWFTTDSVGVDYSSIVETSSETLGEVSLDKQATYLHSFFDYKRGGFGELLFNARFEPTKGFRISQNIVEVLRAGEPSLRASQTAVEVLRAGSPNLRASQTAVEILRAL